MQSKKNMKSKKSIKIVSAVKIGSFSDANYIIISLAKTISRRCHRMMI